MRVKANLCLLDYVQIVFVITNDITGVLKDIVRIRISIIERERKILIMKDVGFLVII